MITTHPTGERAVLVHMDLPGASSPEDLEEFKLLVVSTGGVITSLVHGVLKNIHANYFIGTGKLEEIKTQVELNNATVVIFNHSLTPAQERNLEKFCQCRVIDRTRLILDVFAKRARSHEGKLQVELAQLNHLATRLVRGWTHLERQKGGIGLRGPGETQLETDRRLLRQRVKTIRDRLNKIQSQRALHRQTRQKAAISSVSFVGYTNAGKSTLFNALTNAGVYAAYQLFATLDPTYRHIDLPALGSAILIDTVGFIRHLPHSLIQAFQATLEETTSADLLLHVIDAASEEREEQIEQVENVLKEIHADHIPQLQVLNKIDLLDRQACLERNQLGIITKVWISAQTGAGLDLLIQAMSERLTTHHYQGGLCLNINAAELRARLYQRQAVMQETILADGHFYLEIQLPQSELQKILK